MTNTTKCSGCGKVAGTGACYHDGRSAWWCEERRTYVPQATDLGSLYLAAEALYSDDLRGLPERDPRVQAFVEAATAWLVALHEGDASAAERDLRVEMDEDGCGRVEALAVAMFG